MVGALSTLVVAAVATWVGYGLLLWTLQEAMMFPAPGGIGTDALDMAAREVGAEPIRIHASDGTALYGWYKPAGKSPGRRAMLYFHGNAETVAAPGPLMRMANHEGWDFGVIALRGYPGSEGSPGEEGFALDARALWDHVVGRGVPPERVVLYGRSLGGAVAARLATEVEPGALVLESTFTSMVDMARRQAPLYPVERLLRHPFDTRSRAADLRLPTVVLHGSADGVVPVEHGRALAGALPTAQYVEVPGGTHNDLMILRDAAAKRAWLELLARVDPEE